MDKKPVIFYTNYLCATPTHSVQGPTKEEIRCVNGVLIIKRCTED